MQYITYNMITKLIYPDVLAIAIEFLTKRSCFGTNSELKRPDLSPKNIFTASVPTTTPVRNFGQSCRGIMFRLVKFM
eukprot:12096312-Heterocapsa_arctica.AAC.1